jgi:hypothetical protein
VGRDARGIDGTPDIVEISGGLVDKGDLTEFDPWWPPADWVTCLECGEHIPQKFQGIFLDNVSSSAHIGLIVSWAAPGQPGFGHVNCRAAEWVAAEFGHRGWVYREDLTATARAIYPGRRGRRRLLIFTRRYFACPS